MSAMWVVVMGVSGCGKSSVGAALAALLNLPFSDGDDFHSPANIAKMAAGIASHCADGAEAGVAIIGMQSLLFGTTGLISRWKSFC